MKFHLSLEEALKQNPSKRKICSYHTIKAIYKFLKDKSSDFCSLFEVVITYDINFKKHIILDSEKFKVKHFNIEETASYKFVKIIEDRNMLFDVYFEFISNDFKIDLKTAVNNIDVKIFEYAQEIRTIIRDLLINSNYGEDLEDQIINLDTNSIREKYEFAKMIERCYFKKRIIVNQSINIRKKIRLY